MLDLGLGVVDGEDEGEADVEGEGEGLLLVWVRKRASTLLPHPASGDVTVALPRGLPPMMVEIS